MLFPFLTCRLLHGVWWISLGISKESCYSLASGILNTINWVQSAECPSPLVFLHLPWHFISWLWCEFSCLVFDRDCKIWPNPHQGQGLGPHQTYMCQKIITFSIANPFSVRSYFQFLFIKHRSVKNTNSGCSSSLISIFSKQLLKCERSDTNHATLSTIYI